jgi:hypothetical protein
MHYWREFPLLYEYEFKKSSLHIHPIKANSPNWEFKSIETVPEDALDNPDKVKITDHFLLARMPNPFNKERSCILFSGTGTFGTGYAAVTAGGQQAVKILHSWFDDRPFEIVGKVEMCQLFNPQSDPVTCVFRYGDLSETILLPTALRSPQVWEPEREYDENVMLEDLKTDPVFEKWYAQHPNIGRRII